MAFLKDRETWMHIIRDRVTKLIWDLYDVQTDFDDGASLREKIFDDGQTFMFIDVTLYHDTITIIQMYYGVVKMYQGDICGNMCSVIDSTGVILEITNQPVWDIITRDIVDLLAFKGAIS